MSHSGSNFEEKKSQEPAATVSSSGMFAPTSVPSLKQLATVELILQQGSIEQAEKWMEEAENSLKAQESKKTQEEKVSTYSIELPDENDPNKSKRIQLPKQSESGLFTEMKENLAILKTFLKLVVDNEIDKVDDFLNEAPPYLLPLLLKSTGRMVTYAKGLEKYVEVEGTALRLALGAEAFGLDGCDLCLMPPGSPSEDSQSKKLALYSEGDAGTPLKYRVNGKEWTVERGNNEGQLSPEHFAVIKEMFNNPSLLNKNLNLSFRALNEAQRDAYAALLKITKSREHTLFVNEEGMYEVLERHIKRALPDGAEEIAKQKGDQFPDGWEVEEEKRHQRDLEALEKVKKAIAVAWTSEDKDGEKCNAAIQAFREYLEPKGIIRTGKHWNARLLDAALEMGWKTNFDNYHKYDLFYDQVMGYIQRFAPMNCKQDMAQGLRNRLELGKKSNQSVQFSDGEDSLHLAPPAKNIIGFNSWVDCYYGGAGGSGAGGSWFARAFKTMLEQKHQYFDKLCRDQTIVRRLDV